MIEKEIEMSILDKMTKEELCKLRLRFMAREAEYAQKRREVERQLVLLEALEASFRNPSIKYSFADIYGPTVED